jgi:thiamine biosynthesis lipoprotein
VTRGRAAHRASSTPGTRLTAHVAGGAGDALPFETPAPAAPLPDARSLDARPLAALPFDARTGDTAPVGGRPTGGEPRRSWVEHVMGMPVSVHARGPGARGGAADAAVRLLLADLHAADARFSTYRPDSEVNRLARGETTLDACSDDLREVHRLCRTALERTGGWFDAWAAVPGARGVFDPTGLVKTWAVARAARRLADPALATVSFAVVAGGDVLVRAAAGQEATGVRWRVGVEDPRDRSRVLATLTLADGGVATSGSAARGAHVVDPFTGQPAAGVLAATVVAPSLLWADVWATAAVARGASAVGWTQTLSGTSGMLVLTDGTVHRWADAG